MSSHSRRRSSLIALVVLFIRSLTAHAQTSPPLASASEIPFRDGLVIGAVGKYGRNPLHQDAVEAQIVAGTWAPPKVGESVTLATGDKHTWQPAVANPDGWIKNSALEGGYAYFHVDTDSDRVMILDAQSDNLVYVNGELRAGDPYETGKTRLPVLLHKGTNTFLFFCSRGQLHARLTQPKSAIYLDTSDPTLPDIVAGDKKPLTGAVIVVNTLPNTVLNLEMATSATKEKPVLSLLPPIPPLSFRKVPFAIRPTGSADTKPVTYHVALVARKSGKLLLLDTTDISIRQRTPTQTYRRTFISEIDGSVQYYAVNPMNPLPDSHIAPALFLSLHGASVEAQGQSEAYLGKTWGYIVAPTNRRPFGFDWEDWGRMDALEVLNQAQQAFHTDPSRTYLTGHSMGGHGTWQIGATFPNRFAAIGPSAGWISMFSYAGAQHPENPTPMEAMLLRGSASSDTLSMAHNYLAEGVYILHGDADDNVPISEARTMAKLLSTFHHDYTLYEQPGAGHWWGNSDEPGASCVDWPPMFDMFARHRIPDDATVRDVDFTTVNPGVSCELRWARIEAQLRALQPSSVHLRYDPGLRRFTGTTQNVARLSISVAHLRPGEPITVQLDNFKWMALPWPTGESRLWFVRDGNTWTPGSAAPLSQKGPLRNGPFKAAFDHRMVFVYGTVGTPEENTWAYARARYDAETFWYRGNGAVDVVADKDFNPAMDRDRNVIVYGNASTNSVWNLLLADSPVQVNRNSIRVGNHSYTGETLACLFLRPRSGSVRACVAVISGSGVGGFRLTDRMPYFVSGVGYPDCIVLGPETLTAGATGVRAAGFFGNDWSVDSGEFAWQDVP